MKKIFVLSMFLFICISTTFAAQHPLIGKWKFRYVVGGNVFIDFVTIDAVNTTTKKVSGHVTGQGMQAQRVGQEWPPCLTFTGYYNGNIVFLMDSAADGLADAIEGYMDGYYFTFKGTIPLRKHLGICSIDYDFDARWHSLSVTKLSDSIVPTEITTLNDILNQKALKKQAQLREHMMPMPPGRIADK